MGNPFLLQSNASSVHVNGVSSNERDEESYGEEEEEEEEEDEDEDEEGMDMRGSSRPLSESDLHALEMLEPESSSHDDSIDSSDQLEAAVSLSVLSVGISAVRERSNRALQQRHQMEAVQSNVSSMPSTSSSLTATTSGGGGSGSILVIMSPSSSQPPPPPPRSSASSSSMHNLRESVRLSSSSGRFLSSGDLVPVQSSGDGRQVGEEEDEEHQSGTDQAVEVSFDLDSSTESAGSRMEAGRGGGGEPLVQTQEVTSSTVSVIMSGPGSRTSDGSSSQTEGGGEHDEVVVSSSSNGSNSATTSTTEARQDESGTNNDRTGGL